MKKKLALGGYVAALHVAVAALVIQHFAPRAEDAWPLMRKIHSEMDPFVPAGAVVFLGDSITQALATDAVAAPSVNFGISGQRSDQLLSAMPSYHSLARARTVVVMIGTNDVHQHAQDGISERYRAILAAIPPAVPVVMVGIPPMTGVDVEPVVQAARQACAQRPGCVFADASAALAAPGAMEADGMHPSPQGFALLIALLRHAVTRTGAVHRP